MKCHIAVSLFLLAGLAGCAQRSSLDYYLEGQLAAEQGRLPSAMDALSHAIKENPNLTMAYMARANLSLQQGDYEGAQKDYEQVVKSEPYNFPANFQLGTIYQRFKKFAEAVKAYKRAIEVRPLDPAANMDLALTYVQMGDPLEGLYYAQRARDADPNSPTTRANLGVLYAQAQYHDEAIKEFKASIELDSHQPEVYLNLGQEYYATRSYEQARNVLETARSLAPSLRVSERLGATYYRLGNFDKAEECFRAALKMDPNDVPSLNDLGAVLMTKALQPPARVDLAKSAIASWNLSLAQDKNQPTIQNLVNQYTPRE